MIAQVNHLHHAAIPRPWFGGGQPARDGRVAPRAVAAGRREGVAALSIVSRASRRDEEAPRATDITGPIAVLVHARAWTPRLACRQSGWCTLNHMVQYLRTRFDASFAALSDATRRGVLEQLGRADASITDLADKFHMTLTGMQKHVGVLEQAGLVTTAKVGRVRTCRLGLRRLDEEAAWNQRFTPALGCTVRRAGQGCRGTETEGEG